MNEITNVTAGDGGVVWITQRGQICTCPTDADASYSASVFQDATQVRFYILRKSVDRIVLAETALGSAPSQRVIKGDELTALGDLSGQTDEQILTAILP